MFNTLTRPRLRVFPTIVVWAGLTACLVSIARDPHAQWDFQVFYSAVQGLVAGDNPYSPTRPWPDGQVSVTFLYTPLTLYFFRWVQLLPLTSAMLVWLGLKLVALALLLRLWHQNFERLDFGWTLVLFIGLGFNAALLRDLTSGNISTFEELGVWFGFTLLLRNRPYAAAVVLAFVAQFKLLPVVLIGLIPCVKPQDGWKAFLAGCTVFLGLFALNLVLFPDLTHEYLGVFNNSNPSLEGRGDINPSSLALLRDVLHPNARHPVSPASHDSATLAYIAYLLALLLVLSTVAWRGRERLRNADPRHLLYLGCAVFAVAMPRMKDYTYILMLIPTLFVIRDLGRRNVAPDYLLLAAFMMLCAQPQQTYVPRLPILIYTLQSYLPLFIAAAVMLYLLRTVFRPPTQGP
jgi:hypothetical protein